MKYYAVKKGWKTGIFTTWEECKNQVYGYSNAVFKSFPYLEDAEAFINKDEGQNKPVKNIAYVDGSYDSDSRTYGYGGFIVYEKDGVKDVTLVKGSGNESNMTSMRNVAGEICAAMETVKTAIELGLPEITIYYDYAGVAAWVNGDWKCNKKETQEYSHFMFEASYKIDIIFRKVAGHTGIAGNEIVDSIAKESSGVSIE